MNKIKIAKINYLDKDNVDYFDKENLDKDLILKYILNNSEFTKKFRKIF